MTFTSTTIPSGSSAGTLTGFDAPYGMCADKKGDVFMNNFYGGTSVEYKHGGTSPHQHLHGRRRADGLLGVREG